MAEALTPYRLVEPARKFLPPIYISLHSMGGELISKKKPLPPIYKGVKLTFIITRGSYSDIMMDHHATITYKGKVRWTTFINNPNYVMINDIVTITMNEPENLLRVIAQILSEG